MLEFQQDPSFVHMKWIYGQTLAGCKHPQLTHSARRGLSHSVLVSAEILLLEIGKETNSVLFFNFSSLSFPYHFIYFLFSTSDEAQI